MDLAYGLVKAEGEEICRKDKALCRLFVASCFHQWEELPVLGTVCIQDGATAEELRGTLRHLIVAAGYGPTLKAFITLNNSKILGDITPGKVGGRPGNAFELVYENNTDKVRRMMHGVDPVLGEYIRAHLYGDIYSSPGITLAQKQLLMLAFLGVYHMPDQLFGHLLASLRFGNSAKACESAISIGFEQSGHAPQKVVEDAIETLQRAIDYHFKSKGDQVVPKSPVVSIPDDDSVNLPDVPPPYFSEQVMASTFVWGE